LTGSGAQRFVAPQQEVRMAQILTLSVPDMSCGHCRASIDKALAPLGATVAFDMERRQIAVSGDIAPARVIDTLDRIGFPAEPV